MSEPPEPSPRFGDSVGGHRGLRAEVYSGDWAPRDKAHGQNSEDIRAKILSVDLWNHTEQADPEASVKCSPPGKPVRDPGPGLFLGAGEGCAFCLTAKFQTSRGMMAFSINHIVYKNSLGAVSLSDQRMFVNLLTLKPNLPGASVPF